MVSPNYIGSKLYLADSKFFCDIIDTFFRRIKTEIYGKNTKMIRNTPNYVIILNSYPIFAASK